MKRMVVFALVLLIGMFGLQAVQSEFAVGYQLSVLNSGLVIHMGVRPISFHVSFSDPDVIEELGIGSMGDEVALIMSTGFGFSIPLDNRFDVEIGVGGTMMYQDPEAVFAFVGPNLRAKYTMPNRHLALFLRLDVPCYMLAWDGFKVSNDTAYIEGSPIQALAIATSTVGILYIF